MRQRYIDFVPAKRSGDVAGGGAADFGGAAARDSVRLGSKMDGEEARRMATSGAPRGPQRRMVDGMVRVAPRRAMGATQKVTRTTQEVTQMTQRVAQTTQEVARTTTFSIASDTTELGVIEDLNSHFVKTEVPKRPLSGHFGLKKPDVSAIKAEKVGNKAERPAGKGKKITVEKPARPDDGATGAYIPPRGKFINQGKVEKRPLSKTVYRKKVATPVEEPKGPVTIIAKPEKQNHVGLIVTIILTIILGAAAGTVAFLLLPK